MLIRIRSKDGNFRYEVDPKASVEILADKVLESSPNAERSTIMISNQPRGNETPISALKGQSLQSIGLKHGDLVFVAFQTREPAKLHVTPIENLEKPTISEHGSSRPWETVQEDAVDVYWRNRDGKIPRSRNPQFCRHGSNGMCDYCMPMEPYDVAYHKEENIKHLSYHAYLRKVTPQVTASATSALPPLTPPSYKVKIPCPVGNHSPWPGGICTACQPSAITLQSQPFRMVDHLEIASTSVIERFLQVWRSTGLQRFGWLIGRYEPYDKVPMGIKAVVEAIYEPPQQGELDGLTLGLPWEDEARIREFCKDASTPLSIVGTIFTDLDPTPEDRTKNAYKRHAGTFFLSSLEITFAATLQNANPTRSRSSPTGSYGSRLVTAVLTGTADGQVDLAAYQVSEQASAMVAADMIEPSVDPGIMRVKEEDRSHESARYVPDVFFRYKNEYGLDVKKSAKPCFPVEYLLINVTHGFPQTPSPIFRSSHFAIENRPGIENQSVEQILEDLSRAGAPDLSVSTQTSWNDSEKRMALANWLSDWHMLAFLGTTQLISPPDMTLMTRIASSPDLLSNLTQLDDLISTDSWQTLMTFARESAVPERPTSSHPRSSISGMETDIPQEVFDQIAAENAASSSGGSVVKVCPHCTFENIAGARDCDVCGLPLE